MKTAIFILTIAIAAINTIPVFFQKKKWKKVLLYLSFLTFSLSIGLIIVQHINEEREDEKLAVKQHKIDSLNNLLANNSREIIDKQKSHIESTTKVLGLSNILLQKNEKLVRQQHGILSNVNGLPENAPIITFRGLEDEDSVYNVFMGICNLGQFTIHDIRVEVLDPCLYLYEHQIDGFESNTPIDLLIYKSVYHRNGGNLPVRMEHHIHASKISLKMRREVLAYEIHVFWRGGSYNCIYQCKINNKTGKLGIIDYEFISANKKVKPEELFPPSRKVFLKVLTPQERKEFGID